MLIMTFGSCSNSFDQILSTAQRLRDNNKTLSTPSAQLLLPTPRRDIHQCDIPQFDSHSLHDK